MIIRAALPCLILLGTAAMTGAEEKKPEAAGKLGVFDQFKQLAGEWVGKETGKNGRVHVTYKVTSGGSAVVETILPGTDHEMVTVIHPDGDDLLLTHYCMLGNQPHMKATPQGGRQQGRLQLRPRDEREIRQGHVHARRHVHLRGQGHAPDRVDQFPRRQGSGPRRF